MAELHGSPLEVSLYDANLFDFRTPTCEALSWGLHKKVTDLTTLHTLLGALPKLATRETDQLTPFHRAFYENIHETSFYDTYHAFLKKIVRPMIGKPMYAQTDPNFRVHLPGNRAVGTYHRDSDFGHRAVINYWLPLVDAHSSNTLHLRWSEDEPPYPIAVPYGRVLRFDAENVIHGNEINETGQTRVSIDFRVIAKDEYQETNAVSINTGTPLKPGGYYMDTVFY